MVDQDDRGAAADDREGSNRERPDSERPDRERPDSDGRDHEAPVCEESDCDEPAAVRLHVPWTDDQLVCAAHARVLGRQDGVVAEPLESAAEEFP